MKPRNAVMGKALNALSLIVLAYAVFAFAGSRLWTTTTDEPFITGEIREGSPLRSIDLPTRRSSLVIVLSTACDACDAQAAFYRELVRANGEKRAYVVALFPEDAERGRRYLGQRDIQIRDVRQVYLGRLGVSVTPAVLLVEGGRVEQMWVGPLAKEDERSVFAALRLPIPSAAIESTGATPPGIKDVDIYEPKISQQTGTELVRLLRRGVDVPIVDTRDRAQYQLAHIEGSINIPLVELETRARHELPQDREVSLYCHFVADCEILLAQERIPSVCVLAHRILRRAGLNQVRVVAGDIPSLRRAGVPLREPTPADFQRQP